MSSKFRVKFAMSEQDYFDKLHAQHGGCAICGKHPENNWDGDWLTVDHSHKSGKVRGLLCGACNSGLGFFYDSIENLEAAIKYLRNADAFIP